jgi:hypothetical protein
MRSQDHFPPQGRILTRFDTLMERRITERAAGKRMVETDAPAITSRTVTRADHTDRQRLRGIPAIGYGVSGAIPGTRP